MSQSLKSLNSLAAPIPPPAPPLISTPNLLDNSTPIVNNTRSNITSVFQKTVLEKHTMVNELKENATKELDKMDEQIRGILITSSLVEPTLQVGPICGLVTLEMAAQKLNPSLIPESILEEAKRKYYTKSGEMFSATDMANLAISCLQCKATTMSTEDEQRTLHAISSAILDGNFVLVPYDADYNHSPALRKGHAAHWALLIGLTIFLDSNQLAVLQTTFTDPDPDADSDNAISIIVKEGRDLNPTQLQSVSECLKTVTTNQVYVNARQGKSKHISLWKLTDLMKSNQNLKEIAPKILEKPDHFITSCIQTSLCSQMVVLSKE